MICQVYNHFQFYAKRNCQNLICIYNKKDDLEENVRFIVGDKSSLNNSSKHSEAEDDSEIVNENETSDITKQQQDSNEDNSVLKNEINSLNQEIKSLMKRIKILEEGLFYFI